MAEPFNGSIELDMAPQDAPSVLVVLYEKVVFDIAADGYDDVELETAAPMARD
jgi:hypothetical protein